MESENLPELMLDLRLVGISSSGVEVGGNLVETVPRSQAAVVAESYGGRDTVNISATEFIPWLFFESFMDYYISNRMHRLRIIF